MFRSVLLGFCGLGGAISAFCQTPVYPSQLTPPADSKLILHLHGRGEQIYVCKELDGQFGWTLKAPKAELFGERGEVAGKHFAGPTWQAPDGSRVNGKAVASVPSPEPNSIPWLLITATAHDGNGVMSGISSIQRLNTKGGKASSNGCDAGHVKTESSVAYEADYYFYR